jgi:hypothetical protein
VQKPDSTHAMRVLTKPSSWNILYYIISYYKIILYYSIDGGEGGAEAGQRGGGGGGGERVEQKEEGREWKGKKKREWRVGNGAGKRAGSFRGRDMELRAGRGE